MPVILQLYVESLLLHCENHSYPSQVPPILQEGKDPAWKGLQQDLQLMNVKHTGALRTSSALHCELVPNFHRTHIISQEK